MNNTKLINVLRTFSKSELKEFEKFISSPYFNKGRNYTPFLNELKKFHPKFNDEKMTQEYIYSKIYPHKKFNKQIVWNLTSSLSKMADEFLILVSLRSNSFVRNQSLAEEYYERKLPGYFEKTVEEMDKILSRTGIDDNYFRYKIQIERLQKIHKFLEDSQHLTFKHIVKHGEYTILDFLRTITGIVNDMESNARMFNVRYEFNLLYTFIRNLRLDEIIKYAKQKNFSYTWIMEMSYYSIMMFTEQDSLKHFTSLKKLFNEHFDKLTRTEKNSWFTLLANYCANNSDKNEIYFRKELFEINKLQLKENLYPEDKYFYKIKFIQILRNAILINETQWAKNFIEEYVPKLKPSYQKSMRAFGYAYLNFALKKFDEVLANLKNVRFIDVRDKLHVRNLYIRTYYELDEIEAVITQIDSAKHFLSKNESITSKTKMNYMKSLNLLNRLINAKYNNKIDEYDNIFNEVKKDKELIFGKWFEDKIQELKEK